MRFARSNSITRIRCRRPRSRTLALAHAAAAPGARFAEHRYQHAVELVGACVMMAAFLAIALFA